jgi:hypothetical protein
MPQFLSKSRRRLWRALPLVKCLFWLGGCDGGGGSQTADFPKMGKTTPPSSALTKKAPGMDRAGSEAGYPQ